MRRTDGRVGDESEYEGVREKMWLLAVLGVVFQGQALSVTHLAQPGGSQIDGSHKTDSNDTECALSPASHFAAAQAGCVVYGTRLHDFYGSVRLHCLKRLRPTYVPLVLISTRD